MGKKSQFLLDIFIIVFKHSLLKEMFMNMSFIEQTSRLNKLYHYKSLYIFIMEVRLNKLVCFDAQMQSNREITSVA